MLGPPLQGERFDVDGMACWMAGSGRPLLLVHSVNAAASAAEVRPLFDALPGRGFRVIALELPGFGSSRRDDVDYTPRMMTDAIVKVAAAIRSRWSALAMPALAVSLGCEFLARAATQQPAWFSRLALVSPTGLAGRRPLRGAPESTREIPGLHAALRVPLWSRALFGALTRPPVVRYFLERSFGSKAIDEVMWDYAVRTARQPGAHHAPLAFLAGRLFSADIVDVYDRIVQPVWVSHGTRGDFVDYRGKQHLQGHANWSFTVYEGGALPYFERTAQFAQDLEAFLADRAGASSDTPR
jgi:pimeloyl-ACP methyl ester carboxylesterase